MSDALLVGSLDSLAVALTLSGLRLGTRLLARLSPSPFICFRGVRISRNVAFWSISFHCASIKDSFERAGKYLCLDWT